MVESRASKKGRKGRVSEIGKADEIMENEIWKDFPEDLFEGVLARFFRFRSVCREWNSLLTSESFSQQCGQVKHAKPWFYAITFDNTYTGTGAMYDPSSNKWHHPTVPALPTKAALFPMASAGGLICLVDFSHRSFYVCNPLTRSFKELPERSVKLLWDDAAIGMTQTPNGGYKILCVGSEGGYQVYDSANNFWISPGSMPPSIKLPLGITLFTCGVVAIEGRLYFMRSKPDGLLSYEVDTGMWRQYVVPIPPHQTLYDCALVESGGRIMLVGLLKEDAASCECVCVWELGMTTLQWKEVDRMPNMWCLEFYGKKNVSMSCLGNKDLLMLSLDTTCHMDQLFMYDLSTQEWLKRPGCVLPTICTRKTRWIAYGTACLTAIP
ncbi:hypothetical protein SASPL_130811 [Salvia splendens]|uniref:KIB1-4 beta-propeller domain-containing protein n=1 Tax=Salvia splendens TaxID=180675 RepID=A0A8X8X7M4_SALSN|nr:F-box only protein 6-like [Salvia splendens]KAG6407812.1 hypothetical protein SASPL_130811 [Salvia splendens]